MVHRAPQLHPVAPEQVTARQSAKRQSLRRDNDGDGGLKLGQELLNVPIGDMIRWIALAIADAQWGWDKSSIVVTELMSGQRLLRDLETGELMDAAGRRTGTPTIVDSRIYFGYV